MTTWAVRRMSRARSASGSSAQNGWTRATSSTTPWTSSGVMVGTAPRRRPVEGAEGLELIGGGGVGVSSRQQYVTDAHRSAGHDVGPQAAAVHQRAQHPAVVELVQVQARLAQPAAAAAQLAEA